MGSRHRIWSQKVTTCTQLSACQQLTPGSPAQQACIKRGCLFIVARRLSTVPVPVVTPTTKTKSAVVSTKKMADECKCETTVPPMLVALMMPEVLVTLLGMVTGITKLLTNVLLVLLLQLHLVK